MCASRGDGRRFLDELELASATSRGRGAPARGVRAAGGYYAGAVAVTFDDSAAAAPLARRACATALRLPADRGLFDGVLGEENARPRPAGTPTRSSPLHRRRARRVARSLPPAAARPPRPRCRSSRRTPSSCTDIGARAQLHGVPRARWRRPCVPPGRPMKSARARDHDRAGRQDRKCDRR